jgi:hypothetical protein
MYLGKNGLTVYRRSVFLYRPFTLKVLTFEPIQLDKIFNISLFYNMYSHASGVAGHLSLLHTDGFRVQFPCSFGTNIPIQHGNRGLNGLNHRQFSRSLGQINTKNRC